jgi:3-isopropylmalate/(R)-2-methylmalate dehydratase small subunit
MQTVIRGRVWKFGDNVDTDVMAPWNSLSLPWEERRKTVLQMRPEFVERLQAGDLVVAGRNWGCGSSREHAAENLKLLGLGAVLAESFGRIYFRNCIAIAFPNLVCLGIHAACEDGDDLEVDIGSGLVRNLTRNTRLQAQPYTADMLAIIAAGGLLEVLKQRLAQTQTDDVRLP